MLLPNIYSSIKKYKSLLKYKILYFDKTNSKLHKIVFNKIKALNKQNEVGIDFEQVLKIINYVLQFFILDLCEQFNALK